jgi:enoyl-CoA hydratase/carnithine racemase
VEENVLIVRKEENVSTIVFNRPDQRNSLTPEQLLQLVDALEELKADGQTRVIVFRGAGNKAFSSGYNIGQIPSRGSGQPQVTDEKPPDPRLRDNPLQLALEAVRGFPYPTIAMIGGYCMGAGCELAATCDIRIASDNSRFAMPPVKLNVLYSPTGVQRFLNILGLGWTNYLFLTGRTIDAQKAKEMGFIQEMVTPDKLEAVTYELAQEIAENAPLAVKGTKTLIAKLYGYQGLNEEDRREVAKLTAECFASEDLREAQRAFLEKRKPKFQGR